MKIERIAIDSLRPYQNNAKIHTPEQIEQIKRSIQEFGNNDPIAVDENDVVIEGHGRLQALQELGYTEVEVIRLTHLSEEQKKAYILVHNKLTMDTGFDLEILNAELAQLDSIRLDDFDFQLVVPDIADTSDWFESHERGASANTEGQTEEYKDFVEKFEPKLTTDDCYTPDYAYEVIADYVSKRYKLKRENFVRPFYPGGDYQGQEYKKNQVVVDNPPFSILSQIVKFYSEADIKFFLFAPALTIFSSATAETCTCVCAGCGLTYENGAIVDTSFITNMEPGVRFRTDPDLYKALKEATEAFKAQTKRELTKNEYPMQLVSSAMLNKLSKYGQKFSVTVSESFRVSALDEQKTAGKGIFGNGYLISEKAAAEKAAAETWSLSEREKRIIQELGGGE